MAADRRCGPQLYSRQVAYATRLVAAAAGYADYDLAWQSRSGPPQVPWLEPDVADHLTALTGSGTKAVIVCPIGFVADHIEVVWDLDQELRSRAEAAGMAFARAATPNADRRFARLAAGLIDELRYGRAPDRVSGPDPVPGCLASTNGAPCRPPHCVAREGGESAQAECRIASTAAIRAERTTAVSGRSASLAMRASDDDCVPIGSSPATLGALMGAPPACGGRSGESDDRLSPALTAMIASTCAAFSSTRNARDGA